MYLVIFIFLICVVDSTVLKTSPDVVDIGVFCCLFVVCVYIFGWLCRATYYSAVSTLMLGVSRACFYKKLKNVSREYDRLNG